MSEPDNKQSNLLENILQFNSNLDQDQKQTRRKKAMHFIKVEN